MIINPISLVHTDYKANSPEEAVSLFQWEQQLFWKWQRQFHQPRSPWRKKWRFHSLLVDVTVVSFQGDKIPLWRRTSAECRLGRNGRLKSCEHTLNCWIRETKREQRHDAPIGYLEQRRSLKYIRSVVEISHVVGKRTSPSLNMVTSLRYSVLKAFSIQY